MEKRYEPHSHEAKWQRYWDEKEFFVAEAPSSRPSFCIMIPPPNVTGKLHMGHALQSTLQDLLVRWKRMQGFNALWLPGTDHAGIATQLMVERQLVAEGSSREELGREKFLERMWHWKEQHHDNIRLQLEQLGASCDWSRERFTLDEGLSRAVREAFVRLYREGLIYRGEHMVNWSPELETALSDLEVETRQVHGKLYYIAYPVEGDEERVVVATTRPETMLGDTAVAMHPKDDRYRHLLGKRALLPVLERRLPFIADETVAPDFGTGLVKVTPAHDPADFEMGRRHDLAVLQVIDRRGRMTGAAGADFAGLDRFEARRRLIERLQAEGYLIKVEDYTHNVGHSQRSGEPIEPLLSTQWFCDVSGMADAALASVREGHLTLVPDTWEKTWEHWLSNIKPWCISRQLWWGHQIPAWYTSGGECFVAHDLEEAVAAAGTRQLTQDQDVLDTWFSSALWPFSTLGWPEKTPDLKTFYPTDVLVTAFDILFFWVARMVMTGLHFTGELPFHTVHLTGLIRDAHGQKMSKTKGNVLDPEELVAEYGADAVRFTLAALDSPGRDIPLDPERMAGYRAFCNKIWNATRFALSRTGGARVQESIDPEGLAPPERWILSRLSKVADEVNRKLEIFRFDEACRALYHFFWGELCDWYIEFSKPALTGEEARPRVGEVLLTAMERSLRLLSPVMPHLAEELWHRLPGHEVVHPETLCLAPYPERLPQWEETVIEQRMQLLMDVVTRVRAIRADLNLPAKARITLYLHGDMTEDVAFLEEQETLVRKLCRADKVLFAAAPVDASRDLVAGVRVGLTTDLEAVAADERRRLESELHKLEEEIERAKERLSNEQFLAKAPADVVEGNRQRLEELTERRQRILSGLSTTAGG